MSTQTEEQMFDYYERRATRPQAAITEALLLLWRIAESVEAIAFEMRER